MKSTNRRQSIKHATLARAVSIAPSLHAAGANDKLIIGVIGPGGMGTDPDGYPTRFYRLRLLPP